MRIILLIQIVGILFGLMIMYVTFVYYKKKEFTVNEWLLWSGLGLGFIGISLFPDLLDFFARSVGVSRVMDLLFIAGFLFLISAAFYTYAVTRRTQRQLESVIRKLAIEKRK